MCELFLQVTTGEGATPSRVPPDVQFAVDAQLPTLLLRPAGLEHRELAHAGRADAPRPPPDQQRVRGRAADRVRVRPDPRALRVRRTRRRPLQQAQLALRDADAR